MAIFAVASLGLAIGVSSVIRANQRSFLYSIATTLAQDKLEELKAKSPENVVSCAFACDSPVPTTDNVSFTRTWVVTDNSPMEGIKQIDVTVQWADHTAHTVEMSSTVKK